MVIIQHKNVLSVARKGSTLIKWEVTKVFESSQTSG
jgi:hypothetical protein